MNDITGARVGRDVLEIEGIFNLVPVGRGGFGTVYRGHQADIDRIVAIKVLNGPGHDAEAQRRFRREVTAMGAISHHPNVVPVYAIGVAGDGRPFLVMPYLPGGTLADRLGTLSWQQMVDLGAKMSGALQAAHDVGVLHRDVKPANILWSAWNEPQLADFGIARLHDATRTVPGMVAASLTWAAPEVLEGQPGSPATDVYSLAASLHAAIVGRSPHAPGPDEPMAATVARIASQPAADLTANGVPREINEVIAAALSKTPADRPPSARAFGDALVSAAAVQPARDRDPLPVPTVEPLPVRDPNALVERLGSPEPPALATTAHFVAQPLAQPTFPPAPPAVIDFSYPMSQRPDARVRQSRRRMLPVVAAIAVCLIGVLAVVGRQVLLSRNDTNSSTRRPSPTSPVTRKPARATTSSVTTTASTLGTSPPPTITSPSTVVSVPTTVAPKRPPPTDPKPTSTSTTTPPTTVPTVGPSRGAVQVRDTLINYYRLVTGGGYSDSWARLTPAYQQRTGGFVTYTRFWRNYDRVDLSNIKNDGDLAGTATLRYHQRNGATVQESGRFRFVRLPSGDLVIDDYRVSSRIT